MEGRVFNQDFSLNTPLDDENDSEWIDQVEDETIDTVSKVEQGDELKKRKERGQRNEPKRRSPHDHNPEEVPGPRN